MTIEKSVELLVGSIEAKTRLDSYIAANSEVPRSKLSEETTSIYVNGQLIKKKSIAVKEGQIIKVDYVESFFDGVVPQDIELDIIYEDEDVLVLNKPQGLVVHPGNGNYEGTLVNALAHRYGDAFLASMDDVTRPGIVHRLDKDTSGVMVVALNPFSHKVLSEQFASHTVSKTYNAIAKGVFQRRYGELTTQIGRDSRDRKKFAVVPSGGKEAITKYQVLKQFDSYALVSVKILTGRTHQIRVHMKSLNHPLLGDVIYSSPDKNFPDATLMLHAKKLEFKHPRTKELMSFEASLPSRFEKVLTVLDAH